MHRLRDRASMEAFLAHSAPPELHQLISERMAELAEYDDYDISELVHFLVVEAGDSLASISLELGFDLGDASRPWESFTALGPWHEVVYVLSDDGFGLVLYIPVHGLTDPLLAELCTRSASVELDP